MACFQMAHEEVQWQALVNVVVNLCAALKVTNFLNSLASNSFSRWTMLHEARESLC